MMVGAKGDGKRQSYYTVGEYGEGEIEIEKSKFVGYACRAETEEAAHKFITRIRTKHKDATHNCAAYIVGDHNQFQKADDDGEPTGTAGKPMLEVIRKRNLQDTVIVVTRYFGGVKLGAGGLIRAYGKAAGIAVDQARMYRRELLLRFCAEVEYGQLAVVEHRLQQGDYYLENKEFDAKVRLYILVGVEGKERLLKALQDWTAGTVCCREIGWAYGEYVWTGGDTAE